MRMSRYYLPTLREKPSEAEIVSHQYMLRAGIMRRLAAGLYTLLPLGNRVKLKVEQIIREEMNRQGALEVFMPVVQPAELWQETGRWSVFGKELLRFKDRHERDFCLGPTHEEVITDLVRNELRSYKQLPVNLYQIQTKFRDEVRPRFGVMRAREFIMKDAYSFDASWESLDESYQKMYQAYTNIFTRCGLTFTPVEADTGAIGGDVSHEFMVWAEAGEDGMAICDSCKYAANTEKAEFQRITINNTSQSTPKAEDVHTPGVGSIEDVSTFLQVEPKRLIKTLIYRVDGDRYVAFLVPGHRELNEVKALKAAEATEMEMASPYEVEEITGAPVGFAGPIGLRKPVTLIADHSLEGAKEMVIGANKEDYHTVHIEVERDFSPHKYADLLLVEEGDLCPHCGKPLRLARGIEVGHIFKLGTKYSKAMNATFLDKDGKEQFFIMGCYGIGVTRTIAAAIEQHHDEKGIIWPISIAPFEVAVVATNVRKDSILGAGEKIEKELENQGVEVIFDDRDERAGVKFNDADLTGTPIRITLGERGMAKGEAEIKLRREKEPVVVKVSEVVPKVMNLREELFNEVALK
jgi:prolyl-tRNA synthetase